MKIFFSHYGHEKYFIRKKNGKQNLRINYPFYIKENVFPILCSYFVNDVAKILLWLRTV